MYQLKITIRDSKPPIWRRVLVPEQIPFSELHAVIQLAFGWNDEHLYMFEKGRKGDLGSEYRVWGEVKAWVMRQSRHYGRRSRMRVTSWFTRMTLATGGIALLCWRSKHMIPASSLLAVCVGGDYPGGKFGGLHGYNELLLQARESDNPEQAEIRNFLMLDIERRVYDLNSINDRLQALN
jgi:hypothetical protein